ncbi:Cytochrome c551 peroxidase precursor [compost metagenome]
MSTRACFLALGVLVLAGCNRSPDLAVRAATPTTSFAAFVSEVPAPADNPITQSKVELGFRLWFEPKLSANNKMTCGTCHHHRKGFSNGEATAMGVTGERGTRNTPTIYGSAHQAFQFWDGRAKTLEEQALGPIVNPIEMASRMEDVLAKLSAMPYYRHKFQEAFGTGPSSDGIAKALATFERALKVGPSPYDRFLAGDTSALSEQQKRGMTLFNSRKGSCSGCHNGKIHSNGMFLKIGVNAVGPSADPGRFAVTGRDLDRGAFKVPTLINIAQSAPYMHDGSLATLEAVVDFYDRGGGPAPSLHPLIRPLGLSAQEKADLVAFLHALTGPDNLKEMGRLPGIHLKTEKVDTLDIPAELLP